jgi:hypothetical protein
VVAFVGLESQTEQQFLTAATTTTSCFIIAVVELALWSAVVSEKLTGSQLGKKFLAFYGT